MELVYKSSGRTLPAGRGVAQAVNGIFDRQSLVAAPSQFRTWDARLRAALEPAILALLVRGAKDTIKREHLTVDADRLRADLASLAKERAAFTARSINDTSTNSLDADGDPLTTVRAAEIGVTEGSWATHAAEQAVLQLAGVKTWRWKSHPRCCETCRKLDGQKRRIGQRFKSGDWDVEHAPLHPNCKCTMEAV